MSGGRCRSDRDGRSWFAWQEGQDGVVIVIVAHVSRNRVRRCRALLFREEDALGRPGNQTRDGRSRRVGRFRVFRGFRVFREEDAMSLGGFRVLREEDAVTLGVRFDVLRGQFLLRESQGATGEWTWQSAVRAVSSPSQYILLT